MAHNYYGVTALSVMVALVIGGVVNPALGQPAPTPQTGQTTCYNVDNVKVNDCSAPDVPAGQDGATRAGVAWPTDRFFAANNGTVTDNLTGLIWLQDATCFRFKTWEDALNAANTLESGIGQCGLEDGSQQGAWRLPNVGELESLINYGQRPAVGAPFTTDPGAVLYWSSTSNALDPSNAWYIDSYIGFVNIGSKGDSTISAWPVRGGQ